MPAYSYIARNRYGKISRGEMSVQTPIELRSRLNAMELHLVAVSMKADSLDLGETISALRPSNYLPIRSRQVELFLHQLAIMLRSGLKLLDSIKSLQMQSDSRRMAKLLGNVYQDISRGSSFADALAKHKAIQPLVVQLVHVGEQTGNLDKVLEQARDYLAQRRTTISEVRIALCYPAVVIAAALGIAGYLVIYVIPQLKIFLSALGKKLPAMTQSLVDLASWLSANGLSLVLIFCVLVTAVLAILTHANSRLWFDQQVLKLPILGTIFRLSGTAGFAGCLSTMLSSGVKLVEALRVSGKLQTNRYLEKLLDQSAKAVASGQPLAPSISEKSGFNPMLGSMVEVAERAGDMEKTLQEVANFCTIELKAKIKRMTQMVEPAVILIAGGIVGYVYIAFFIALMSAGGNIK
ncbi:MAG: type II secretion system F family protein [Pirellulales bacterium]